MELVENSLECSLDTFLDRPLFCFVAALSRTGKPRISPLWYLWEDDSIWIIGDTVGKSYVSRIERRPETAVAIVDFDVHSGLVQHVGMRGESAVVPLEEGRVFRLLRRYLGPDEDEWDPRFAELDPERWAFLRFDPETVVARDQSFVPSL